MQQAAAGLVVAGPRGAWLIEELLYQPEPKPVVYVVPIRNILGRLALTPYGEHGTIPYDWRHLQASHYPRGVCDLPNRQGSGSELFYVNSWAMYDMVVGPSPR
jgi:hypothetical protein